MTNAFAPQPEDKFSFGLWTVANRGRDPFGDAVRPTLPPVDAVAHAGRRGRVGREPARQRSRADRRHTGRTRSHRPRVQGRVRAPPASWCRWRPSTCSSTRSFRDGAFTSNDPRVRAYALQKTMQAMDLGAELGAKIFVLWGGREGRRDRCVPSAGRSGQAAARRRRTFSASTRSIASTDFASRSRPSRTSRAATSTWPPPAPISGSSRRSTIRRWSASTPRSRTSRWPASISFTPSPRPGRPASCFTSI